MGSGTLKDGIGDAHREQCWQKERKCLWKTQLTISIMHHHCISAPQELTVTDCGWAGVRARQEKVVFVTCEDEETLQQDVHPLIGVWGSEKQLMSLTSRGSSATTSVTLCFILDLSVVLSVILQKAV